MRFTSYTSDMQQTKKQLGYAFMAPRVPERATILEQMPVTPYYTTVWLMKLWEP